MAKITFPTNKTTGTTFTANGIEFEYDGKRWIRQSDSTDFATQAELNTALSTKANVSDLANKANTIDLTSKVSKSGDTMTGLLDLPTMEFDKLVYNWQGSTVAPIVELKNATNYGIFYHEGSPDQMYISTSGNTNYELEISSDGIIHKGNKLATESYVTSAVSNVSVDTSNMLTSSGSWYGLNMPGTRAFGVNYDSGEFVLGKNNPVSGKVSVLVDGNYYSGENGGFYSLYSASDYNKRRGFYADASGDLQFNATIVSSGDIITNSDERLKTSIENINDALETVKKLQGKKYTKDNVENQLGFLAQEVEQVLPQIVHTSSDESGTKSVNYQAVIAVLVEAIKDQQQQIDDLKGRI